MTGEELRQRRDKLKLLQSEAAARLGLSTNFYARLERGEDEASKTVSILAHFVLAPRTDKNIINRIIRKEATESP
jgi:transcriptional regulator with XRE-family HTH domain